MVPVNDEAGAPECAGTAGQNGCSESVQTNSTTRPDPATIISVLAEMFPGVFVADHRQPHRPLKLGVHQDLVDRGVLQPPECRALFRVYTGRRKYQQALVAGGARFDLDGTPVGEVTAEEQEFAKAKLAQIKQRLKARARNTGAAATPKPEQSAPVRLGLAGLKAAAAARRARMVDVGDPTQAAAGA